MKNKIACAAAAVALSLFMSACGNYAGGSDPVVGVGSGGGAQARSMEEHFNSKVQPSLDNCRSCHVPGGISDVEGGRDFMLSQTRDQDLANLKASWERLGRNNPTSRILLMSSGQETPHSGGSLWPVGSASYKNMEILLKCFESPSACASLLAGSVSGGTQLPLLGSARGGHAWFAFCEDKADAALLPPDPRSLVVPGVNQGKAVYYNAFWKNCHADPELVGEAPAPKTCGELRAYTRQGETLLKGNGAIGAGSVFAGDDPNGLLAVPARRYNRLWQNWGLSARPDNFDQLAAERFGFSMSAAPNPYPLPGEDPNQTNGGSGKLPTALTQLRSTDGSWSGKIGVTCHLCHSGGGGISDNGENGLYGGGNSLYDLPQLVSELAIGVGVPGGGALDALSVSKTRGTSNALALQLISFLTLTTINPKADLSAMLQFYLTVPNGGSLDTPAWWNMGHRPVKFQDGIVPMDALRGDLGFFIPILTPPIPYNVNAAMEWVKEHARADTYLMSLKSPEYPLGYDQALAEQGAVLFHAKDLWAPTLNNPTPRPKGGNGSCASCHGAYSPRFVNDPAYLDTPALEGVASYVVPKAIIGTDPRRVDSQGDPTNEFGKYDFFAYPETINNPPETNCGTQNQRHLNGGRDPGLLAPPLYGIWASAPYFHNGSVPDVRGVLDPADRPAIWRRVSTPARADQQGKVVMGFDTDMLRAYDDERLGWKFDALACGTTGVLPYLDCDPGDSATQPIMQRILSGAFGLSPLLWYLPTQPVLTRQDIENRKIYNTHEYSQGNQGHEFTSVLTEQERRAIIEYLKTL